MILPLNQPSHQACTKARSFLVDRQILSSPRQHQSHIRLVSCPEQCATSSLSAPRGFLASPRRSGRMSGKKMSSRACCSSRKYVMRRHWKSPVFSDPRTVQPSAASHSEPKVYHPPSRRSDHTIWLGHLKPFCGTARCITSLYSLCFVVDRLLFTSRHQKVAISSRRLR